MNGFKSSENVNLISYILTDIKPINKFSKNCVFRKKKDKFSNIQNSVKT